MRKSRLYLALSIISLFVGVALGEAKEWGIGCHGECPFTSETQCERGWAFGCDESDTALDRHYHEAYRMLQAQDYPTMAIHAEKCAESDGDGLGLSLLGFARRGEGRYDEAIAAYTAAIDSETLRHGDDVVLIDSLVGRAASHIETGDMEPAKRDLSEALERAEKRNCLKDSEGSHYQLACVYATRSRLADDRQAYEDRLTALSELQVAVNRGFDNWAHMHGDLDLLALRNDDRFQSFGK